MLWLCGLGSAVTPGWAQQQHSATQKPLQNPRRYPAEVKADSLKKAAAAAPNDSVRCELLWRAYLEYYGQPVSVGAVAPIADQLAEASRRARPIRFVVAAHLARAHVLALERKPQAKRSLDLAHDLIGKDSVSCMAAGMIAQERMVRYYYHRTVDPDHTMALEMLLQAIALQPPTPMWTLLSSAYRDAAHIFSPTGDHAKVRDFYIKSLYCARRAASPIHLAAALVNLNDVLQKDGKPDSALALLNQALLVVQGMPLANITSLIHMNRAELLLEKKQYAAVYDDVRRALAIGREIKNPTFESDLYLILAKAHYEQKQYAEAEQYLNLAIPLFNDVDDDRVWMAVYRMKVGLAEAKGDYAKALTARRRLSILEDSMAKPVMDRERLLQQFESHKRELEITNLRRQHEEEVATAQRQKMAIASIILAAVLFVGFLLWLVRINRQLRFARKQLEENHRTIQQQYARMHQVGMTKDKLFNIIAHDLRGPVTGFMLLPDMIDMAAQMNETALLLDLAQDLKKSSGTLAGLLDRLLTWAQSQNATLTYAPETLFAYTVLGRQRDLYIEPAKNKNITLHVEAEEGLQIYADRDSIETAMRNLLNNAVKFTPEGGDIYLRGYKKNKLAVMEVTDTGVGMSADRLAGLFSAAATPHTQGTAGEQGVGLGLLLVKELVDHNNGTIDVSSEPGRGTTFRVWLPLGKEVYADPNAQQAAKSLVR